MRLDYRKTFLIGFGFFASSLAWSLYNSFVPLMLEKYLASTAIIGTIMTIDNFFGVIFQPLIGQVSDRTHTRFGKRMPYIMIGIPVCAVLFTLIPLTNTLALMMSVIIAFNLVMSVWRSPVVALMPEQGQRCHQSDGRRRQYHRLCPRSETVQSGRIQPAISGRFYRHGPRADHAHGLCQRARHS